MLKDPPGKLRCRHCHLTISKGELGEGYCPECFEETGEKRYDFESADTDSGDITRFRCEDCGALIKADN